MEDTHTVKYSMDIKHEALYYISIGLPIIPLCTPTHEGMSREHRQACHSMGKAPIIKGWPTREKTSGADIHLWFSKNQHLNIGVPLGSPSQLIGIDIDGQEGEKILQKLSKGNIPITWEFTTGKGRRLLYKLPLGMRTKKKKFAGKKPNEEFAIICDGQQTVLPPSRHSSGRLYRWKLGPQEMPRPEEAPDWVIKQIEVDGTGQRTKETVEKPLKEQPAEQTKAMGKVSPDDWDTILQPGERNDGLTKRAGSLIGRGMSAKAAKDVLINWSRTHCIGSSKDPLTDDEIDTIVTSIAMAEATRMEKNTSAGVTKIIFKPTPFARMFTSIQKDLGYSWKYATDMGTFYRCDDLIGPWEKLDLDYVKSLIREVLRDERRGGDKKWDSVHYVIEAIEALKSELVEEGEEGLFDLGRAINDHNYKYDPIKIICVKNGVLHWEDLKLLPWSSDIYTTITLPVEWDPEATCPNWLNALNEWLPIPETVSFLQEYIGLCLIPDTSFRTAVFLYGTGANGKSMFLDAIRVLFGTSLVSIPLHRLTTRFEIAYLQNKLINICGDIDAKYISDTGVLKTLIGGDILGLHGEFKHGRSFDFTPVCRLMFSANSLPNVKDKSVAWYSRWKFLEFPKTFPLDPAYKIEYAKLFDKERAGIFKWAVEGLIRLKKRNQWTDSMGMMQSEKEYRLTNDNVMAFLYETTDVVTHSGNETTASTSALHEFYKDWINKNLAGSRPVGQIEFTRRVQSLGYKKSTMRIRDKTVRSFMGLRLKAEYKSDYESCLWLRLGDDHD